MALSERLSAAATSRKEAALNRSIVINVLSSSFVHRTLSFARGNLRFCSSSSAMRACRVASSASMEFMVYGKRKDRGMDLRFYFFLTFLTTNYNGWD